MRPAQNPKSKKIKIKIKDYLRIGVAKFNCNVPDQFVFETNSLQSKKEVHMRTVLGFEYAAVFFFFFLKTNNAVGSQLYLNA